MLDKTEKFVRQADFLPQEIFRNITFHLVGYGGINSVVGIALGKVGGEDFRLYDDDKIEIHNVPNQLLSAAPRALGMSKVDNGVALIKHLCGDEIYVAGHNRRVEKLEDLDLNPQTNNFLIVGPDNMSTRSKCWQIAKKNKIPFYLDARMACRVFKIYCLRTENEQYHARYEATLHDDAASEQIPCTDRAVFHTNMMLGAAIVECVRNAIMKKDDYYWEILFDLSNLDFMWQKVEV